MRGKVIKVVDWIFAVFFLIFAISTFLDNAVVSGIFGLLAGVIILPPIKKKLINNIPSYKKWFIPILVLVLFFVAAAFLPGSEVEPKDKKTETKVSEQVDIKEKKQETKKEPKKKQTKKKDVDKSNVSKKETEKKKVEKKKEKNKTNNKKVNKKDERKKGIERFVKKKFKDEYGGSELDSITINEHLGTENPDDYILLVYADFKRKKFADTTEKMINMYSSDLAASIAEKYPEVQEVVVMWDAEYIGVSAKCSYERRDDGRMYIMDKMWNENK